MTAKKKRIVLGMTGASGVIYGFRLLDLLLRFTKSEIYLVCSPAWKLVAASESGLKPSSDFEESQFFAQCCRLFGTTYFSDSSYLPSFSFSNPKTNRIKLIASDHFAASIASGSFPVDGMVIAPCSSSSLGCIANGINQHLVHRAAEIQLKERRRLILLFRESPYSLIHIENMRQITKTGGIIQSASPHFYLSGCSEPPTVGNLVDTVLSRTLDLLGIEHDLARWDALN